MDIRHAIRTTGSVRDFLADEVALSVVADILDDARFAPSGGNRQPWRVAIIADPNVRRQLAELMRPTWNEYVAATKQGQVPFNSPHYETPTDIEPVDNSLLDLIESVPVVLVVAADLTKIVATDNELDRAAIVPGASIYPFCWSVLLSARAHGLGGVITTFLSRSEPLAAPLLNLPDHHALAATIFLGYPAHQPTKLSRRPVESFTSLESFDGPALDEPLRSRIEHRDTE